ncbi:hypothetical protein QBC36DRAFT_300521 [Triangularia setosa]|uniref:BTB domain-containing protein n=1 Tax=Triangularia setosa TaxID=2587417 RepID=A0AAN6W8V3_9PEZI|nr:hypothetical protein QBC36DRAFT_300521 [Podospora setosa]
MGKSSNKNFSAAGSPASIDNDGDLILRVGGAGSLKEPNNIVEFKVDSTTLRRASPVFKALLFGPWLESTVKALASPAEPWTVSLPDDEPSPFTILMGLAHANYKVISRPWDTITIYELLVLADKYDMMHLFSPFTASMKKTVNAYNIVTPNIEVLVVLYCSWALGDEKGFAKALRNVVLHSSLDNCGTTQLVYSGTKLAEIYHLGPADLLDYIAEVRQSILAEFADCINNDYKRRMVGSVCVVKDTSYAPKHICDDYILGGLHRSFTASANIPYFPINPQTIQHSCRGFYEAVLDLLQPMQILQGHLICFPKERFEAHVTGITIISNKRWEPGVLIKQEHRALMRKKRETFEAVV